MTGKADGPDRRTLLIASLATAATGIGASETQAESVSTDPNASLPPLDGALRFDDEARAAAADDFGHIIRRQPKGVLFPASDQDVARAIRWARDRGLKVAAQGQRHSVYGRAQASSGIVIDMTQLRSVHAVEDDRISVAAGAKWSEVLAATIPRGLTPPVLPECLELSVGGTLVVGGIGGTTFRYGALSDNAIEIDVVTGNGENVTCSASDNAELFNAVRAGLGQVGVITRATLKLIKAPLFARRYVLTYRNLAVMLADQRLMAAENRFDVLQGAIVSKPRGWMFQIDAVSYMFDGDAPDDDRLLARLSDDRSQAKLSTLSYLDYLNRLAALERLLRSNGQWLHPHPWLTTFVGDSAAESIVGHELDGLKPVDLGRFGQIVLSPLRRSAIKSPLLRTPPDELIFAFNFVRIPETSDIAESERLVLANRAIYDRVRASGGALYPVSAFPMSNADWRDHFGPQWTQLRDAKDRFDPAHVLTPGYAIF